MGRPVKMLVVDPARGYQREIVAGESPVDGDGNPVLYPGYGPPVDDIPALRAVLSARRVDQQVRLVEDADPNTPGVDYPSNYAWDSTSTEADDPGAPGRPPAIVLPDDAPAVGRWIRVYSEVNSHYEIHEIGGRDEITVENLITGEYGTSSSSSSPSPGDPIQVLVPDGGGGVQWVDLNVRIEDSITDETNTGKVLQPDGLGGVAWQPYDPVIEGDLDMNCNDILHTSGVYFCDFGSSSGSGSSGETDLWIRPDYDTGEQLEYHATGGHRFESPVMLTGDLFMSTGDVHMGWTSKLLDDNGAEFYFSLHEAHFIQTVIRSTYSKAGMILPRHENTNTDATAAVGLILHTYGDGDAWLLMVAHDDFGGGNEKAWSAGIDGSDADKYKIHNASTLADVSLFELTTAGALTLAAGLTLGDSLELGGYDITDVGSITMSGDLDMDCGDILFAQGIYFCDFGSSSGSGSSGETDLWIRPDFATGEQLEYHATGGHRFESPVYMTGSLSMNDNTVLMGGGGIGNDAGVMTFAAGGTGEATLAGAASIAGHLGIVTAAHADRTIYTEETSAASNPYGLYVTMTGTDDGEYVQGGLIKSLAGANDMASTGLIVQGTQLGTLTGLTLVGLDVSANHTGSSGPSATAIYVNSVNVGSGTVTDAYGIYIAAPGQSGGTLSNAYSLYVNAPSTASTLNWAIYSTGAIYVGGDVLATSFTIGGNTLDTAEWAKLEGLDQTLAQADSPTFGGLSLGGNLAMGNNDITGGGNVYVISSKSIGISGNELLVFNDAGNITVSGANLFLGSNGIGNNDAVMTFEAGAQGAAALSGDLNVVGHVETDDAFYLGDPTTDGTWRIRRDGQDLVFEQLDGEGWDECDSIIGCASSSSA